LTAEQKTTTKLLRLHSLGEPFSLSNPQTRITSCFFVLSSSLCTQIITTKEIVGLKKDAKVFGFFVESPKLDSVKAATVQQRLVNQQLWPSRNFFRQTFGKGFQVLEYSEIWTVQFAVFQQTTDYYFVVLLAPTSSKL